MYYYFLLLVCVSTAVGYNTQTYFDPSAKPVGVSADGGAHFATFNFSCDPWRNFTFISDEYYEAYKDGKGEYCPEELRSPSGCGDFKGDTRGVNCSGNTWDLRCCSMKRVLTAAQPNWKQAHLCAQDQIPQYQSLQPTLAPFGNIFYPPFGANRHRPYWAVLGDYEYLPPERWLHNTEHGWVAFLYRPCMSEKALCRIKQFILSRPYDNANDPSIDGPFRWIMTPYKDLVTKFAIVTYPQTLLTDCFDENDWNEFIDKNYRQSLEDFSLPGRYSYLWKGNSSCPGFPPKKFPQKKNKSDHVCLP